MVVRNRYDALWDVLTFVQYKKMWITPMEECYF